MTPRANQKRPNRIGQFPVVKLSESPGTYDHGLPTSSSTTTLGDEEPDRKMSVVPESAPMTPGMSGVDEDERRARFHSPHTPNVEDYLPERAFLIYLFLLFFQKPLPRSALLS